MKRKKRRIFLGGNRDRCTRAFLNERKELLIHGLLEADCELRRRCNKCLTSRMTAQQKLKRWTCCCTFMIYWYIALIEQLETEYFF